MYKEKNVVNEFICLVCSKNHIHNVTELKLCNNLLQNI